jgi:GTPase
MEKENMVHRTGFIALIGRPNCGKSTLMNTVLGEDLAVVTPLPQTTQKNLKGIYSSPKLQLIFIDTPGIHQGAHALNKNMAAQSAHLLKKRDLDVVCYIVDCSRVPGDEEDSVVRLVENANRPAVIVFNKKDFCLSTEQFVNSFYERYPKLKPYRSIIVSAITKSSKDDFLSVVSPLIPEGPELFSEDELTDANMRFFAAENIRKHIIYNTKDEVPHASFVEIRSYKEDADQHRIEADIHVETDGQKAIIIGKKGALIQKIQHDAAIDLEKLAQAPVSISCHVKISPKWRDNERFLRDMGMMSQKKHE